MFLLDITLGNSVHKISFMKHFRVSIISAGFIITTLVKVRIETGMIM